MKNEYKGLIVESIEMKSREMFITFTDGTKIEVYASIENYDEAVLDYEILDISKPIKYSVD